MEFLLVHDMLKDSLKSKHKQVDSSLSKNQAPISYINLLQLSFYAIIILLL